MKIVLDSSTTWSLVNKKSVLSDITKARGWIKGSTKHDEGAKITKIGTLKGNLKHNDNITFISIGEVRYAKNVDGNIIRVKTLENKNLHVDFGKNMIYDRKTNEIVAKIHEDKDKLPFTWLYLEKEQQGKAHKTASQKDWLMHRRNGHLGPGTEDCDDCKRAKSRKKTPKRKEEKKKYHFGEVMSMDTDVMSYRSLEGYKYRQDIVDHGTNWIWCEGLKKRKEHTEFVRRVLNETKGLTKELRVDGALELKSTVMQDFAEEYKFNLKKSARYTHEHVGKVERSHGVADEMGRAMMNTAGLPHDLFWNPSTKAAVHVRNRHTTKANENSISPYEKRYGIEPDTSHFRVFGCAAYPYKTKEQGRKSMENRSELAMFVGYPEDGAGYLVMDLSTLEIRTEGYVDFIETQFPGKDMDWDRIEAEDSDDDYDEQTDDEDEEEDLNDDDDLVYNTDDEESEDEKDENIAPTRRSRRERREPERYEPILSSRALTTTRKSKKLNFKQAMQSDDKEMYRKEIIAYLQDLMDSGAIEVIKRPKDRNLNAIGSRWVCYKKYNLGRTFLKPKVRWTPFGYEQKLGVDYSKTFAPVAISASNRLVYVIAARWNRKRRKAM